MNKAAFRTLAMPEKDLHQYLSKPRISFCSWEWPFCIHNCSPGFQMKRSREWSAWQQVWYIWASDTYSYGIPIQYSTKCEIWKYWLSPANCGSGLALLLFFNPHKRRRIQCNSQLPKLFLYYQQRRFESWNVLDSSTLWEWGVDCTLWLPVINCYSFRSNCLTEPELCFVLSADFQDFGWAQQGDGSHFQGTDLAPDSDFRETWGCPEYFFKPEPFFLAWTKTEKPIPLSSVCKTERGWAELCVLDNIFKLWNIYWCSLLIDLTLSNDLRGHIICGADT